jgi:hypothetical protein
MATYSYGGKTYSSREAARGASRADSGRFGSGTSRPRSSGGKSSADVEANKLANKLESLTKVAKARGIDTARSDAMVAQTRAEGAKSFKGSSFDKGQKDTMPVMTPDSFKKDTPIQPVTPAVYDPGNIVSQMNAGTGARLSDFGINYDQKAQQFVQAPTETTDERTSFRDLLNSYSETPDQSRIYDRLQRRSDIEGKRSAVNEYTTQLNAITAESQAAQLALEGQGRGQTEGFIGGEQARINREAAIRALPVQAQLSAAQGDLEMAQAHVDKMFQIESSDALARYNGKVQIASALYNYADKEQQRRLDAFNRENDRSYDMYKTNLGLKVDLAKSAMANGQFSLAASIMGLDAGSATFNQDYASLMGRLVAPKSAPKAPTTQNVKRADGTEVTMQYNYETGGWEEIAVGGNTPAPEKSQNQLDFMLNTIENAEDHASASGRSGFRKGLEGWFVGATDYTNLVAETNTLRTNMLTMATDPTIKKFFGPQMSNADVQLMTSAGTTLNPEIQSPAEMKDEIERIKDFTARAKMAVQGATQFGKTEDGTRIGVFPDGTIRDYKGNIYNQDGKIQGEENQEEKGFFNSFLSVFGL